MKPEDLARRFVYKAFCDYSDKQVWKRNYQQMQDAQEQFTLVEIIADGILEADGKYEALTGINPFRFCGHTPPVTVAVFRIESEG